MTMKSRTADETKSGINTEAAPPAAEPSRQPEDLPPAALRALAEAAERRAAQNVGSKPQAREIGGRGGEDPARYGDWEVKGIAVDF